jgi:hypothetical protein
VLNDTVHGAAVVARTAGMSSFGGRTNQRHKNTARHVTAMVVASAPEKSNQSKQQSNEKVGESTFMTQTDARRRCYISATGRDRRDQQS